MTRTRHPIPTPLECGYGRCIGSQEYDARVFAAQGNAALSHDARDRAEFDALIDHRLGEDFPADRREALHEARAQMRRKLPWVIFLGLVKKGHDPSSQFPAHALKSFSQVLSPVEARRLLDLEEDGG